jgi:predicted phage terminase large subunit-like protein
MATKKQNKLDVELIKGFQRHYLLESFDDSSNSAGFHETMWKEAGDPKKTHCAWAAPRGHAKSTAVTFTFALTAICFRFRDHIMIVSDSETQASSQLKEIRNEFSENEDMCRDFGFRGFLKETDTEIILEFTDGYQVRVFAKGSEQRLRGLKWKNKRPNMVIGDDMEYDEIVDNPERLKKFINWFYKALLPVGSKDCLFRIVGTILAFNSLLMRLMSDDEWTTHLWKAHEGFDDFTNILWPERWPEKELRKVRQLFINSGKKDGYAQEYLNQPIADGEQFFDVQEFLPIPIANVRDWERMPGKRPLTFYASMDLAVSQKTHADYSVITIASFDSDQYLDIVDRFKNRVGSKELVDKIFEMDEQYSPELWVTEKGTIIHALMPYIEEEMRRRGRFLSFHLITASKDKLTRARNIQARIKAGRVRWDMTSDWYEDAEMELQQFPRGAHDDFVDTLSQLGIALNEVVTPPTEEELEEEEYREEVSLAGEGRNKTTGY